MSDCSRLDRLFYAEPYYSLGNWYGVTEEQKKEDKKVQKRKKKKKAKKKK